MDNSKYISCTAFHNIEKFQIIDNFLKIVALNIRHLINITSAVKQIIYGTV